MLFDHREELYSGTVDCAMLGGRRSAAAEQFAGQVTSWGVRGGWADQCKETHGDTCEGRQRQLQYIRKLWTTDNL